MAQLPTPIAEIFTPLQEEVTWLHGRWICYRQLFAESERRIEMLNECAGTFFFVIQNVLFQDVQVGLSKLTDPARTGKFDNLSLLQLQTRIDTDGDASLAVQTRVILDTLLGQCAPFRELRNKRLAHLDLLTSLKASPTPLPSVTREMIENPSLRSVTT